jgi:3-oxoacyl-[acyl-carrier protein] reductase
VSSLAGRVALLTGASGGIGKGIARGLADEGVDLFLTYGRHGDDAEEVAAYARALGRRVVVASADLADATAPARLVEQASSELGGVDILVANAGTGTVTDGGILPR